MRAAGVAADEVTYNALIDLHRFDAPRVLRLLLEMEKAGVLAGPRTFTKAARAMCSAGLPEEARKIGAQMEALGIRPDARFYEVVGTEAARAGMFDEADRFYREAVSRGLAPARSDAAWR